MTPQAIRTAISSDPALKQLVVSEQWDALAAQLSAGRTVRGSVTVTAKKLASLLGTMPSELILMAIEKARDVALASADPVQQVFGSALRRQLKAMDGDGIDFGDPQFLALVDQLVADNVWTSAQGAALKAISQVPDPVSEFEIRDAVFDKQGNPLV